MLTITTAFRDFRTALSINTTRLTRDERTEAIALAEVFVERLKIEAVADQHGWEIPAYGTGEWEIIRKTFIGEIS